MEKEINLGILEIEEWIPLFSEKKELEVKPFVADEALIKIKEIGFEDESEEEE